MKGLIALVIFGASFGVSAQCIGTDAMSTCYDNSGNSYTVNRMGNTTIVNGRNSQTGSNWSQTTQSYGNQTYTNGRAANGQSWNQTQTNLGNGNRMITGRDSQGRNYSTTCTKQGCY